MRTALPLLLLTFITLARSLPAQQPDSASPSFADWFEDRALRLEFVVSGHATEHTIALQEIFEEPCWPENPALLVPTRQLCSTRARIYDAATGRLICQRSLDTLFSEYTTTTPATQNIRRAFEFVLRFPLPKAPVRLVLEERSRSSQYEQVFETDIRPDDLHIRRESVLQDEIHELKIAGPPQNSLDITFLSEGYTAEQAADFKADVQRMADFLMNQPPYNDFKDRLSIRGVFRPSPEQGTDEPHQRIYKNTNLGATFNIFDLDRYLLSEQNHNIHRMAAQVPSDTVVVLANSKTYGGGAVCLDYCISTTGHNNSPFVFLHEFAHSFAGLADEYTGNVAYNQMYPEDQEPMEANITRNLNRETLKWRHLLSPDVELPTPELPQPEASQKQLVGAFEGGGYVRKGIFRSEQDCWMGSLRKDEGFCAVCREAIRQTISGHLGQ
ncbi:MAG: M64 family metallopeptidase [Planctomyces sp.]